MQHGVQSWRMDWLITLDAPAINIKKIKIHSYYSRLQKQPYPYTTAVLLL